jgi:cytochrome c biogenesis protein CcdA
MVDSWTMLGLLLVVASIAVFDSLNPSTIGPALYLATTRRGPRTVGAFALGVFVVSFAGGLVLALGPGQLLLSLVPRPKPTTKHWIELAAGAIVLVFAGATWATRRRISERLTRPPAAGKGRSAAALGGAIMAVELPTAFPYFGAIAAIVGSDAAVPAQVGLLLVFNAVFVSPLLALMVLSAFARERSGPLLELAQDHLRRHGAILLAIVALAVGVALVAVGAIGLAGG